MIKYDKSTSFNDLSINQRFQGPHSQNDDPRSRMREVLAVSF